MSQITPEQIQRFMSGQVRCWNNHDKAGLLALYRELLTVCQAEQQRLAGELVQLNQSRQGAKVYQLFG